MKKKNKDFYIIIYLWIITFDRRLTFVIIILMQCLVRRKEYNIFFCLVRDKVTGN